MTRRQIGIVLKPLIMLVLGLSFGCAQQMQSVKSDPGPVASATAQIQSITVAEDGSKVEIVSNKAIIYTYYMLENPPRVIVDIAQTTPGSQSLPMLVNNAGVRQLHVSRHEFGSGVLSRIDITLNAKTEISASLDQQDKKKLILLIPSSGRPGPGAEAAAQQQASEAAVSSEAPVQISEPQPVVAERAVTETQTPRGEPDKTGVTPVLLAEAAASAVKPGERALTAIRKIADGLLLETSAEPDSFKAFKLTQPDRLVIDLPKTRNAIPSKVIEINDFNLGKARIGSAADKLRIVFDATGKISHYTASKNESGLKIAFDEGVKQAAEVAAVQDAAKIDPPAPVKDSAPVASVQAPMVKEPRAESSKVDPKIEKKAEMPPATTDTAVRVESPPPPPVISSGAAPTAAEKKLAPGTVAAVEYSQIENISRITVSTSGGCRAGEPVKINKGYALSIKGCRLPVNLQRPLDTRGFVTEITSIAPFSVTGKAAAETRIAVNLRSSLPNTLKKTGDIFEWDFKEPLKQVSVANKVKKSQVPAAPLKAPLEESLDKEVAAVKQVPPQTKADSAMDEAFALEKVSQAVTRQGKTYTGRKVTLEFSDADIKKIFQLLAEVSNQNILVSDDVTGTISLKLVNVPWDQALDVILENKGLGMQKDGNIVQIRPKTKMKSLDDEAVEMRFTEEKKMPLSTVIFDINFATLAEIEGQFKNLKSKRSDASISSDIRTNKIIVVDIDPNISKMRKLLEQLDIPEKQVMIEARIVEASSTFARDLGVKWGFGYSDGNASVGNISGAAGSMGGIVSGILPTATTGGLATGVAFGKLLSNFQLDMRLSAAATVGQIKIVSTPKVMTVNNKPAKISQGQMIPYQNTSSQEGAVTEFIEAALSLEVTPHITADGSVNMKIKASNNTAGVGSPPPINKKEATTELVVKNGETTVIGGIYVDSETEGDTGVPYLSDIPFFGNLFKSTSKNKAKNELLIFITPRIMN